MNCHVNDVRFGQGLAFHWGLQVRVLICFDLHSYCHIPEGIGHALKAGEQATSSFI
jgi:hypothetical protein